MPSLRKLQQAFAASVYADTPAVLPYVSDGIFPAARHVAVYRHHTFASLTEALSADYPVVRRLVGDGFFEYAADGYIRRHPPPAAHLHGFGADFADFLADFPPAQTLAYLPDVARLEWAWQEAYHAGDAPLLDLATLAALPPEKYSALTFQLHPSVRLVASAYPISKIWMVNQPDFDGDATIDLDQGGERLLIARRELTVEMQALDPGADALLRACAQAQPLAAALAVAIETDPAFDLTQALQHYVQAGVIVGYRVNERPSA